jgi:hypothetical protein
MQKHIFGAIIFIMKKRVSHIAYCLLLMANCLVPHTTQAQEIISKRGEKILPEKGDWGMMFDAVPFIRYAGNALNASAGNSVTANFPNGFENTLVLKKYKADNRALRIKLRLGFSSDNIDSVVVFLGGTNPDPSVTDSRTVTKKNIAAGLGTQKSVSKGRVTGYFGKEILIGYATHDTTYDYGGGPLTQFNWLHTNTFGQERGVTEIIQGSKFSINFHLLFGVEYFFAPKMSLSAEYSWGIGFEKTGEGKKVVEAWDFSSGKIKTTTTKFPGSRSFIVDNANNVGSINLALYF